jgi:hypothetical protein
VIEKTLMVFGPGGIGKSPIDRLIRSDAVRIDPYRMRSTGPRDRNDVFYAHPKLRAELTDAFTALNDPPAVISSEPQPVEWFPKSRMAMFRVRDEWQCLMLGTFSAPLAKAEIYAPTLSALLRRSDFKDLFGVLTMVILNPVGSLHAPGDDLVSLREATAAIATG